MRIAFVTGTTPHHSRTRATARLEGVIQGLVGAGHDCPVVTTRWWGDRRSHHHDRWSTHHAAGASHLGPTGTFRRLVGLDPDIVHLLDVPPSTILAGSLVGTLRRVLVVYEASGFDAPIAANTSLAGIARGSIDRAIVPAEAVETTLLEAGVDVPVERIADPIDIDEIRSVVPNHRADIVWSAPGHGEQDLEMLLLGLAELRRRDWQALLLGPLDAPDDIHQQMTALGIADRIEIIPRPSRRERIAYYRGASAFVQTAAVCPFPIELLRAMAAGCVGVVQYRERSSAHELVEAHPRGELISTPEELASSIRAAAGRDRLSFDDTFERYDIEAVTERLGTLYRGLLTGSS